MARFPSFFSSWCAALLAGLTTAPAPAKPPSHNAGGGEPRIFEWTNFTAAIMPDSVLGVVVLARPENRELTPFLGRFLPAAAGAWAAALDSLLQLPTPEAGATETLPGDDGSFLAFRADSAGRVALIFRAYRSEPYSVIISRELLHSFAEALQAQSRQSAREAGDEPPVSHDAAGAVFWLIEGDSGSREPSPVSLPAPHYPPALRERGMGGFVWLRYVIDTRGRTEKGSVEIIWASHPDFGRAAADAVRGGRFRPGRYKGAVVRSGVFQTITFSGVVLMRRGSLPNP